MEQNEIDEDNKLIAEFMEGKPVLIHLQLCKYDKSWDWLIPVVEKIESIKDDYQGRFGVHIVSNTCTIQATNYRPDKNLHKKPYYFNCITLETKIESTFCMVVNFIKWYNKQKK